MSKKQATVTNPNRWLNVRSGAGTSFPLVFQVERGSTVDVLDDSRSDWWQISQGSKTGWASAQYLTLVGGGEEPQTTDDEGHEIEYYEPENKPAGGADMSGFAGIINKVLDALQAATDGMNELIIAMAGDNGTING